MKKNKIKNFVSHSGIIEGTLVGGFSTAIGTPNSVGMAKAKNKDCITTNNCNGANCRMGCGSTR